MKQACLVMLAVGLAGAMRLPALQIIRSPLAASRTILYMMSDVDDAPQPPAEEVEEAEPADVPLAPAEIPKGPTMPVSSTFDKIKGFAAIAVVLVALGFILDYSFSPNSPLLAPPGEPAGLFSTNPEKPKVNKGMEKYVGISKYVEPSE